jgi:hypothetical protein
LRITYKPNGDIYICGDSVLPPFIKDNAVHEEGMKIAEQYLHDHGPLGLARSQGMNEKEIYATLMDKGPCGLCKTALEKSNK